MLSIDLNCDMGESTHLWQYHIDKDLSLLPFLSSINLACGFHAGDAHTMHQLVEAALTAGEPHRLKRANVALDEATQRLATLLIEQAMAMAKK